MIRLNVDGTFRAKDISKKINCAQKIGLFTCFTCSVFHIGSKVYIDLIGFNAQKKNTNTHHYFK